MSNSINFTGRLGNDAESKKVGENTVCEFSVANNVGFKDNQKTNWFRCALWGKQGIALRDYLTKGKEVFISGELTLRPWTNNDGVEKMSPDVRVGNIDLIGGKKDDQEPF